MLPNDVNRRRFPTDPIDDVPLAWSSAHPDGVPIRAGDAPPYVTRDQMRQAGVMIAGVRSKVLQIPAEMDEYLQILNWISTGAAVLRFEKPREDPNDPGKWTVWLCWAEIRGYVPQPPR